MENKGQIWTAGHSTLSADEFITMLKSFNIEVLADIRAFPGSRRFPHFNKEALENYLPANNIQYVHIKELGGRKKPVKDSHNTAWKNESFRGYADYMETDQFKQAVQKLETTAFKSRTAYMCSEAVWWSCHRSLVSDYLKVHGWEVIHIMKENKSQQHPYTSAAHIIDGKLSYKGNELFSNEKGLE